MLHISPIIKTGTKIVVHITADSTHELITAGNDVGVGVRDAGRDTEHISVTPHEALLLETAYEWEQLEEDIY